MSKENKDLPENEDKHTSNDSINNESSDDQMFADLISDDDNNEYTRDKEYEEELPDLDENHFTSDKTSETSVIDSNETEHESKLPVTHSEDDKAQNTDMKNTVDDADVPKSRAEIKRAEKKKKKKKKIIASSIAVAVIIAGIGGFFAFQKYIDTQSTTVPQAAKFISYDEDTKKVCKEFVSSDLKCQVKWEINDNADRGRLLSQSVASDEKVDNGTNVVLTYSNGPSTSEFPNLNGVNIEEAKKSLYSMNIEVSEVKEVDGNGLDKDEIVSTNIEPGTKVKNGDTVTINVSNGNVKLPDWSGKTKEYVEADADKLGIKVKFTEEESDKASGIVISQTPKAGETTTSTEINVVLSKSFEAKEIKIPDVIGKTAEEAQTELATAGFRQIKTVKVKNAEVTETQVTQVVPGVGQKGNSEENIVIIVSEPIK